MNEIRAFVGHSFTEDDADVVDKFLKYFDQLSKSHPHFSWEHAESAEPKELAEKVLQLLVDKNVFIGICTKKERVIAPTHLKATFFPTGSLRGQRDHYSWKTSDWIIQEIGLAKGLKLDLVLLVERGLRQPGGLQGNVEYIDFEREAPERCFGKIVEMIAALSPKTPTKTSGGVETAPLGKEGEAKPDNQRDWTTPHPSWTRNNYEFAYMYALLDEEPELPERISAAYLATESGMAARQSESWRAYKEYIRIDWGKGGELNTLKRLAVEHKNNSEVHFYLGRAYEFYKQEPDAATTFEVAAANATDPAARLKYLRLGVAAHERSGNRSAANRLLEQMRSTAIDDEASETQVLLAQKAHAELTGDDDSLIGALERMVELNPADVSSRFSLAYKHSELGNESAAVHHYLRIPYDARRDWAWNNLGAAFDQVGMPAKAVQAYRKSQEMGNTLAMSNLALKFIAAGFLTEAQEVCEAAILIKDYHKNVAHTTARLKEVPEEEDKKEAKAVDEARPLSEYYARFGRAAARPLQSDLAGPWQGPDCVVDVSYVAPKLTVIGQYTQTLPTGLLGLAMYGKGMSSGTSEPATQTFRLEYRLEARGRAFWGSVRRGTAESFARASSLLGLADETKVLMILNDDGDGFAVMERAKGTDPKRYTLTRQR